MRFWPTLLIFSSCILVSSFCFATTGSPVGLGHVAKNVSDSMENLALLIQGAAYVAGLGFALAGMLKFKAHKDNPQQVQLSTAIVLLAVGAGLVFIPSLLQSGGATLFGQDAERGSFDGKHRK
jgi:intracellular multiplication protein IcmD